MCEVKAFGPNRLTRRLQLGRFFSTLGDELWTPVRDQVRAAARTLKPVQALGLPLVVVITNTDSRVFVDLSVETVTRTLLGVGGKLTRDHRYLSAIALMRREDHAYVEQRKLTARRARDDPRLGPALATGADQPLRRGCPRSQLFRRRHVLARRHRDSEPHGDPAPRRLVRRAPGQPLALDRRGGPRVPGLRPRQRRPLNLRSLTLPENRRERQRAIVSNVGIRCRQHVDRVWGRGALGTHVSVRPAPSPALRAGG